jgi:hypothetical protein
MFYSNIKFLSPKTTDSSYFLLNKNYLAFIQEKKSDPKIFNANVFQQQNSSVLPIMLRKLFTRYNSMIQMISTKQTVVAMV